MRADTFYGSVKLLCTGICGLAVYGLVAAQSLQGHVPVGDVLVVYSAVTSLILSLSNMAEIFTDLRNNNTHLTHYFAYMDLPEEGRIFPALPGTDQYSRAGQRERGINGRMAQRKAEQMKTYGRQTKTTTLTGSRGGLYTRLRRRFGRYALTT